MTLPPGEAARRRKERKRLWYWKDRTKNISRVTRAKMVRVYGITLEERDRLEAERGGRCDICGKKPMGRYPGQSKLHIDHDHATGKFRGMLCTWCNMAIGHLGDNLAGVLKAVEYLSRAEE